MMKQNLKRFAALFMAMVFTLLISTTPEIAQITAGAEPAMGVVESISFTPAKEKVIYEKINIPENPEPYTYYGYGIKFEENDKITVTYTDGTKKVFTYKENEFRGNFVTADGEVAHYVDIEPDPDSEYKVGKNNFIVTYSPDWETPVAKCTASVTVKKCPIKSLTATYRYPLYAGYNCNFGESFYYEFKEENVICTLEYPDGTVVKENLPKLSKRFDENIYTAITLSKVGINKGSIMLGEYAGDFEVEVRNIPENDNGYKKLTEAPSDDVRPSIKVPSEYTVLNIEEYVDVKADEKNPVWFSFTALATAHWITIGESDHVSVYDQYGNYIGASGYGDGTGGFGGRFFLEPGTQNFIRVQADLTIGVAKPHWMPTWTGENGMGGETERVYTQGYKFEDSENLYWNVYSLKGSVEKDFGDELTYWAYGTMSRLASPVNVYSTVKSASSSSTIYGSLNYKFDPNDEEDCYRVGSSTEQDTMKDELLPGEKEYRFDNVYYLSEETGVFTFSEERLIYVPVGYYITDDNHVKQHNAAEHTDSDNNTECDICGIRTGNVKFTKGDIDGIDGVNAEDARLALRASVGLEEYANGTSSFFAADADKDGSLSAEDARLILRASVGLEILY